VGKRLYRPEQKPHVRGQTSTFHHGKSEKETTSQDVEAQTPEAPQGQPPQEAHVAEVSGSL
jgi:hypothetical protein